MVLHLYAMCYNEIDILPFVVDYWKKLGISKAIIFDNYSTDGSAEFLQRYDWIDVRHFYSKGFNDIILRKFKNECWKESRGKADFVIVCDIDECLISPFGMKTFDEMKNGGYTICSPKWYEFISEEIPIYKEGKLLHEISEKAYFNENGKTVLFNPNEIKDINYGFGAHKCEPTGNVSYYDKNIYLLHIARRLSLKYMINKYKEAKDRNSFTNKINSYSFHYSFTAEKLKNDYESWLKISINFNELIKNLSKVKQIALCCIGRLENRYAVEFVDFYKNNGVDKIFIYDNNHDGEEYFEDVLQEYIDNGFVEIIDFRNMSVCQLKAYQDCYDKHGKEYDWICFFDFDEFVYFEKENNLKDLLSYDIYKDYDIIHINWLCYDDNGLVRYENKPVIERFKNPILPLNFIKSKRIPENYHIKSIVRGGLDKVTWNDTSHTPSNELKCCDSSGNICKSTSSFVGPFVYKNICLRHYSTKTIEEYYTIKVKRGFADDHKFFFEENNWVETFFSVNKKTNEKYEYINEVNNVSLDMFIGTYKTFTPIVKNPVYKIIYGNHNILENNCLRYIKCVSDELLDDRFYSEFYMLKNLPKNYKLAKYVGFCHYRKYFNFFDRIPNLDELFKEYDAVMADPTVFKTNIKNQYAKYHNIEDLEIVEDIIKNDFSEYYESLENVLNRDYLYCLNMFIMKKEDFNNYIKFIDSVLQKYIERVGVDIKKRIEDNKEKYLKDFSPNDTVDYQYRIGGYLAERLTNVFAEKHFKNIKTYKVKITEYKY